MKIGVVYPQIEMNPDVGEIKAFAQGVEAIAGTPEEASEYMRTEIAKWARVVKESGATIQ